MMDLNDRQYERIARQLDGENVELSDAQRGIADEIRRSERQIGAMLQAELPEDVLQRVGARLAGSTRPRKIIPWRYVGLGIGAAVAAAIPP